VAQVVSANPEVTGIGEQPTRATRCDWLGLMHRFAAALGKAAKERLEAMIGSQTVLLEFDVQDKALSWATSYVWQDKILLNERLALCGVCTAIAQLQIRPKVLRCPRIDSWGRGYGT